MAQRRMFSQRITNSARFQQMAPSAQALYFHLGMAADDDGIVEAFMVMRTTKAAEDDFRVLVAKKFVIPLNEEQVSYILDWNEHNLIRPDRLTPSIHRELLVKVIPDVELANPRRRADLPALTTGRPMDNQRTAQVRLGEVRLNSALEDEQRIVRVSSEEENAPKKVRDVQSERAARYWVRKCQEEIGQVPTGGVSKHLRIIKDARKALSYPQIKQVMDEWFENEAQEPHEMIQITRCLSSFRIDKFLAENV